MYMQSLSDSLGELMEMHIVAHRTQDELPVRHALLHYLSKSWKVWSVRANYLKLLDTIRPDIVHVNCCWQPYFAYAALWAKEAGYPVVLSPHGMLEPWIVRRHYWTRKVPSLLAYQRRALFAADVVHATAESEKENIETISQYCRLLSDWHPKVHVIGNSVDTQAIEMKTSWKRSKKLLFLSRIHPKKGIDLLLRAVSECLGRDRVCLELCLPPEAGALRQRLFEMGAIESESYDDAGCNHLRVAHSLTELAMLSARFGGDLERYVTAPQGFRFHQESWEY